MNYTLAGFTFVFAQDANGDVISITTPDIAVGPFIIFPSSVLNFSPAITVDAAVASVTLLLHTLGLV